MVAHWLAELDGRTVAVEVPATSANLGAGYDCLGVALALTDRIELEVRGWSRGRIELTVEGEGRDELPEDRDNRFVRGLEAALTAARGELPAGVGWRIVMHNRIPLARGLGSSAAATVAGLVAGNALLGDPLGQPELLRLATDLEGHPDNAAAALLGGFTISARTEDGGVDAVRFDPPRDLRAVLFIPELRLSTEDMRDILPDTVPLADAVANIGAVALGVAGLASGRYEVLKQLTVDRLHEPYRAKVYPQLPALIGAAREAGAIGACLSGAGSSILAFADSMAGITRIEAALLRGRRRYRPARPDRASSSRGTPARGWSPRSCSARAVAAGWVGARGRPDTTCESVVRTVGGSVLRVGGAWTATRSRRRRRRGMRRRRLCEASRPASARNPAVACPSNNVPAVMRPFASSASPDLAQPRSGWASAGRRGIAGCVPR